MKTEKVFEILGEGGGICIKRQKNKSAEIFLYGHQEFDPTDEGLDVNKNGVFKTFEEPFQIINSSYSWYMLYLDTVHDDYRNYIIEKLIEKLNENIVSSEELYFAKNKLEDVLQIKLSCKMNKKKEPKWSFTPDDNKIKLFEIVK